MNWELKTLDQLGELKRGKSRHRPRNDKKLLGGKYPLIQTAEIQASNLFINDFQKTYNEFGLAQSLLWSPGTLCISIVGANTAESAILNVEACFPDSVIGFNAYKDVSTNLFVKYLLDTIKDELKRISVGAARENLSMAKLLSKKSLIPEYQTQVKIANILSNYDILIETNLKRIKLLEEAAQHLYKEWFVNFRFPGSESTPIKKETGLPEGWESVILDDCIKIIKGKKPKVELDKPIPGSVPYLLIDVLERRANRYAENFKLRITEEEETLMVMDGSRSGIVLKSIGGAIGSTLAVLRITDERMGKQFCYQYFKLNENDIISKNTGAAIPHANKSYILNMEIVVPDEKIIKDFEHIVNKQSFLIQNLNNQIDKLKKARDLLLPRLMNRTLEV
ncbi:type I restriction enzyme S subunit [Salegentibacter sp. 24]|uniref:restriction endonuclease subunit S n=1 Tax=Salegentibacter sp. 24 TaxID=2183986 RepID=UPI00105D967B|nr:restriction endonuclease subunit S [Salegentibacter sp. 24]TDN80364.1 type I restriction enzyme S subunit [Salegentibacter sp. 24]